MDDAPTLSLNCSKPPAIALPRETSTVVLEPVTLASDTEVRPREVEAESADGILAFGNRERARANEPSELDLEARLHRRRSRFLRDEPSHAGGPRSPATAKVVG
jgi:hypothetical protein